ncbi:MAG TPA: SBBP repeat-containing protein, partial [Acidobacteriota bacterium]|nr:SBBP repeat-containing protein [Acidobacteriota bacterium]
MTGSNQDEIERKKTMRIITLLMLAFCIFAGHSPIFAENRNSTAAAPPAAQAAMRLDENYGKLPLSFELNCGQTDSRVKFLARSRGYDLFLTTTEAVLRMRIANRGLRDGEAAVRPYSRASTDENGEPETTTGNLGSETVLRMKLVGASSVSKIEGIEMLPGRSNYFIGSDARKWLTDIPTYSRVRLHEVYPGIDLVYYGNQHQLEYDFIVHPGADAGKIAFDIEGADKVEVSSNGDLLLHAPGGVILQRKAIVYQEIDGLRKEIASRYVLEGMHRLRFRLPEYDGSRPLVIDPTLDYSTYLGGSGRDQGFGIAVDSTGNAYVTGETTSANFPITPGTVQSFFSGGFFPDAFVAKLNAAGSALVYSTYLGGNGRDQGFGIAVDTEGNAYVAGATFSTNFPTTPGALKRLLGGIEDAFVAKLNPTGSALVYSTYVGGSSTDFALGIALDAAGNAYVTGGTHSADFP